MNPQRREDESCKGSASIEATISLVFFCYVIVAIYMLVNFCVVQAKVAYAIDTTAKEMSQYSYFYHALGLPRVRESLGAKAQDSISAFQEFSSAINSVDGEAQQLMDNPGESISAILSRGGSGGWEEIQSASKRLQTIVSNPVDFMTSLGALALGDGWDYAMSHYIAAPLASAMTKRHFEGNGVDANTYLSRLGVVDGYDGLDFSMSTIFASDSGKGKRIEIVVYYKLSLKNLIPLPALNREVTLCQRAITEGWLGGDDPR